MVVIVFPCPVMLLMFVPINDICDVIVAFKLLIKCVFELMLLKLESSLIVFADIVGSIEVIVNPCAVILLKLLVVVAF